MKRTKFNNNWVFGFGSGSALASAFTGGTSETVVNLPHDMSIILPRDGEDALANGNGYFQEKNGYYKKTFSILEQDINLIHILHFEGVYQNAYVYVNDCYAYQHPYGYGEFYVDLTPYLHIGENQILVVVKNEIHSGRWYTGGGIYRDVWLLTSERLHIVSQGVQLTTRELDDELAVVEVKVGVLNQAYGARTVRSHIVLKDCDGKIAWKNEACITVRENEEVNLNQMLYVKKPKKWSAETPDLYQWSVTLTDDDTETFIDSEEGTFGLRILQLDPIRGLRVNGKSVKLKGGCIHHDNGIIGARSFAASADRRIAALKRAGYNAIRSAHYPLDRNTLNACDRLGMYVMDEYSDVWTTTKMDFDYGMYAADWWQYDIDQMVYKDFNHPSVILYSIGNEIPEVGNRMDVGLGRKLAQRIRALDTSRFTLNSLNLMLTVMKDLPAIIGEMMAQSAQGADEVSPDTGKEINETMTNLGALMAPIVQSERVSRISEEAASQIDIVGYNYAEGRYENDGTRFPGRILVGSETNPIDLDKNWKLVEKLPYVIGDFAWTAWDYLGEVGIGAVSYGEAKGPGFYASYPYKAAYCGDLNILGDRRPVSYWREQIWENVQKPYIAVQDPANYGKKRSMSQWTMTDAIHSWTFAGYEGKPVSVEIYSVGDTVELILNGKLLATCPVGEKKQGIAYIDTVYESGVLEVIAYKNGVEIGRDRLVTANRARKISVETEGQILCADGRDVVYVDLRMEDENGTLNYQEDRAVRISITGPGEIVGFGSASPCSEENYFDLSAKPYEGRLQAVIRANGTGEIRVTFSADQFPEESITLRAEA